MKLNSIKLSLSLPEIVTPESQFFYDNLNLKLKNVIEKVGRGNSSGFAFRCVELKKAGEREENVVQVMTSPLYILPLLDLWQKDTDFLDCIQPSPFLLKHIISLIQKSRQQRIGRIAFREFLLFFFKYYGSFKYEKELSDFLICQFDLYQSKELLFGLDKLQAKCRQFITPLGHIALAEESSTTQRPLIDLAEYYGIAQDSSFVRTSQYTYYVKELKQLRVNETSEKAKHLLFEVQDAKVANARISDTKRLGHEVLTTLIDKLDVARDTPNELWMNTLLGVGGDPRIQRNAQEWWDLLGDVYYKECMYSWLSAVDIELFLKIWKEFAEYDGDKNLQRMYPPREKFLRGLIKQKNLVRSSRLFVGSRGVQRINTLPKNQRPHISKIQGRDDLAIVYLNLGNGHLVEGSHSFSLAIMDKLPHACPFATTKETYSNNELISPNIKKQYEKEFGNTEFFLRRVHNGNWQQDAHIMLTRLGLRIPYDDLVDRATYMRAYR